MGIQLLRGGDGVAEVVLDFPPVNALPVDGWFELAGALAAAGADPAVRAVILEAEGRGFCAGVDIKQMQRTAGHEALATVGRLIPEPGGVNGISSRVTVWLDARAPDEPRLHALVGQVLAVARAAAVAHGVDLATGQESVTPAVDFGAPLRERLARAYLAKARKSGASDEAVCDAFDHLLLGREAFRRNAWDEARTHLRAALRLRTD